MYATTRMLKLGHVREATGGGNCRELLDQVPVKYLLIHCIGSEACLTYRIAPAGPIFAHPCRRLNARSYGERSFTWYLAITRSDELVSPIGFLRG
jgi:hypothetical protein